MSWKALFYLMDTAVVAVVLIISLVGVLTSRTYQDGLTARLEAREQTRQVQAREWNATARTWGAWGMGGLAVVAVAGVSGWAVVRWQTERTRRAELYEVNTTQRHMISAKRDIALAYIAQCGDPGAYAGRLDGQRGVFLPAAGEFVPEDVCRAELAQQPGLVPYQPARVFRIVGSE